MTDALIQFEGFALALALAFFFGLAFEDFYSRANEARPGGVRTFPLLALTGALLYLLDPARLLPLSIGFAAVSLWVGIYYLRRTANMTGREQASVGLVIPICNILAFLIGAASLSQPHWVPVGITAAAVLFLTNSERLHRFAQRIEPSEFVTAGKFLVLTGLVLPLLPNEPVSDLTPITPYQAWLALVAVSGISYASYLLRRYVLRDGGALLVAVLGGLYSSTATTVALARQTREGPCNIVEAQAGILFASSVMFLRVLAVVAVFDFALAKVLAFPALSLAGFGLLAGGVWFGLHRVRAAGHVPQPRLDNPLALSTGALFAALFVAISVVSHYASVRYGVGGIYAVGAAVGLADIDPFIINLAEGGARNVSLPVAASAILVAASSNNLLKAAYALFFAGAKVGRTPAIALTIMSLAGIAAAIVVARI